MKRQTTLLDAFTGSWRVRRKIIDHRVASVSNFVGEAVLTKTSFEEHGEMSHGGVLFPASRNYRLQAGGDAISVLFASGAPFIDLDLRAAQTVHHHCGDDDYAGRFFFRSEDAWAERWCVTGPRKRYVSLAYYDRMLPPGRDG
jgi:hypothetical protein